MRIAPLLLALATLAPALPAAEPVEAKQIVAKILDDLEVATWPASPWNNMTVTATLVDTVPDDLKATSQHSMRFSAPFIGSGFQHGSIEAPRSLAVPGTLRVVRLHWRGEPDGSAKYPLIVNFVDGWGRSEVNGKKLEWSLGDSSATAWAAAEFRIPADWKQPVRIQGLTTHNWNDQKTTAQPAFLIDRIEVEADIAGADPLTGLPPGFAPDPAKKGKPDEFPAIAPLFAANIVGTQTDAEVYNGLKASYRFIARSWRAGIATGTMSWDLSELKDGVNPISVTKGQQAVTVDSVADIPLDLNVPRLGLWRLSATVTWKDQSVTKAERTFACLPVQPELSDKDKDASPWGINAHGGHESFFPAPFRRAGVVWFRDYAFTYDWMERAKGPDKKYADWPYYPPLVAKYESCGARILPVLVGATKKPGTSDGPDRDWRRSITDILSAFPRITAWEVDNEFEGMWNETARKDSAAGWPAMRATHKAFVQVVDAAGGGELLTVQNGDAGIHPERVRDLIQKGDFAGLKVINCHHYCGVDSPEENIANQNTGGEGGSDGADIGSFHDRLTALVDAARVDFDTADKQKRQVWITEFGWDTRIGKVVTPYEQACFLQRGFLLTLHAGLDKAFWYWWQDHEEKAKVFFDGCGLLDFKRQPKLALAAFGAMTAFLPSPKVLGSIEAGPGTLGYLMQQGDQRIAAIWSVEKEMGPTIEVGSGELHDMLGNALPSRKATLTRAPLWITKIDANDRFVRQAAYELASPWLAVVTAGDPLTVKIRVRGDTQGNSGSISLMAPSDWKADAAQVVTVAPGNEQLVELHATVPANLAPGEQIVPITVTTNDAKAPLKRLVVRVMVRPALALKVSHLSGEPGAATVQVTVANRSARAISGTLLAHVPKAWSVTNPLQNAKQDIPVIAPGTSTKIDLPLQWTAAWDITEQARVEVTGSDGVKVSTGIIPGAFTVPQLKSLQLDGDLAEWPANARIPDWCLDRSTTTSGAEIRVGWTPEGLAIAVQVTQTALLNSTPNAFWDCDSLEVLIDHRDRATVRKSTGGERMFWLIPQPAQNSVFVGQWKRGNEIAETRNGIPEAHGASRLLGNGYVMEALIPTSLIPDVKLATGTRLSGLLLLAIRGKPEHSEVGWPATKGHGTGGGMETWPLLVLGN